MTGTTRLGLRPCVPRGVPRAGAPLEERMGWDGIDELRAELRGWRTRALRDLPFRHHRPEGARDGARRSAYAAQGRAAHYMGYRPSYLVAAGAARGAVRAVCARDDRRIRRRVRPPRTSLRRRRGDRVPARRAAPAGAGQAQPSRGGPQSRQTRLPVARRSAERPRSGTCVTASSVAASAPASRRRSKPASSSRSIRGRHGRPGAAPSPRSGSCPPCRPRRPDGRASPAGPERADRGHPRRAPRPGWAGRMRVIRRSCRGRSSPGVPTRRRASAGRGGRPSA